MSHLQSLALKLVDGKHALVFAVDLLFANKASCREQQRSI